MDKKIISPFLLKPLRTLQEFMRARRQDSETGAASAAVLALRSMGQSTSRVEECRPSE